MTWKVSITLPIVKFYMEIGREIGKFFAFSRYFYFRLFNKPLILAFHHLTSSDKHVNSIHSRYYYSNEPFQTLLNDIEHSDMIVVWGTNPSTDLPPIDMKRIIDAHNRGTHVVVIDPRKTRSAKLDRTEWIAIRPGTDGALALGMCNVLIEEELYDEEFVKNWTIGFEDFSRYVQHFSPGVVEGTTGIPGEKIVSLARRIAQAKGASQLMYTGLEYSNCGVQAIRSALVLWALTGQLDRPGGDRGVVPVLKKMTGIGGGAENGAPPPPQRGLKCPEKRAYVSGSTSSLPPPLWVRFTPINVPGASGGAFRA